MIAKTNFLLSIAFLCTLPVGSVQRQEQAVSTTPIGPLWQMERPHLGVSAGQGVALSPDGTALLYMAEPEPAVEYASLLLMQLETGEKTLLRPSDKFMMPHQPSFSPDGRFVVFTLLGPTWSYPADVCVVNSSGGGLRKITKSVDYTDKPGNPADPNNKEYWVGAAYQRYYYSPRFSPDGSRILLWVHDVVGQIREFTAIMNPGGSDLQILAEGRPVACR